MVSWKGQTNDEQAALESVRNNLAAGLVRITQHADEEMIEEEITWDQVAEAIESGRILEHYAAHKRGACCLIGGSTRSARPIHVVCTTTAPVLVIITVYEPKQPKWLTPTQRGT